MSIHLLVFAMIIVGLSVGVGATVIARRTAYSREQALNRQKTISLIGMTLAAAALLTDAFDTPRHRWLDAVLLIVMACGVAFDLVRARRAKTS